jgi:superfamily II DNA or RNA helicase
LKLDSILSVERDELSEKQWAKLLGKLTFLDNEGIEVSAYDYLPAKKTMRIARGAWYLLPTGVDVVDLRSCPPMPKVAYVRDLGAPGYEGQKEALRAMIEHEQGRVIAPPGRGKTEIVLAFAALCKTRTLVIVHTYDLFKQWVDRAAVSTPGLSVGEIRGSECQVGHLTIAMAQTLRKKVNEGGKFWRQFGCLVIDEAHHAAAETWEWILNVCPAKYRYGVTASKKRSDGRQRLLDFNVGPIIYEAKFKSQVPMTVRPVATSFKSKYNGQQYRRIVSALVRDKERNALVASIARDQIAHGSAVLVLSREIGHLEAIYDALAPKAWPEVPVNEAMIVTGRVPKHKRDEMIQALRDGELNCILGTQIFEEGVDIPRLNTVILAYPGTEITALQKVGRASRKFEGKEAAVIFDLVDEFVRPLVKQWLRRRTWYRSVGITTERVVKYGKGRNRRDDVRPEKKEGRKLHRLLKVARPNRAVRD